MNHQHVSPESLPAHQRNEDDAEARTEVQQAQIEAMAADMMIDGGTCDPLRPSNIMEAIEQLTMAQQLAFGSFLNSCMKFPDNESARTTFADWVVKAVREYWEGVALYLARERMQ